jgi:hypothetical protein
LSPGPPPAPGGVVGDTGSTRSSSSRSSASSSSCSSSSSNSEDGESTRGGGESTAQAPPGSGATNSSHHSSISSHSSGELPSLDDEEGSSGDAEGRRQASLPPSSNEEPDSGSVSSGPVAGSAPAGGVLGLQGGPVSPVGSAPSLSTDTGAASAGTAGLQAADGPTQDEAQQLQQRLAEQQHRLLQQQAEGRQQQEQVGRQPTMTMMGRVWAVNMWMLGLVLILLAKHTVRVAIQALFVPLCVILPTLLTGRTLLVVAGWLLGTPASGVASSIASCTPPPPAAAAAAADVSVSSQQQAAPLPAPWLPITAPVVLLNWTLGVWRQLLGYIHPHLFLPLSLADVTALTVGGAALCTIPWAFFLLFAILTKYWGLEPGADTQQVGAHTTSQQGNQQSCFAICVWKAADHVRRAVTAACDMTSLVCVCMYARHHIPRCWSTKRDERSPQAWPACCLHCRASSGWHFPVSGPPSGPS